MRNEEWSQVTRQSSQHNFDCFNQGSCNVLSELPRWCRARRSPPSEWWRTSPTWSKSRQFHYISLISLTNSFKPVGVFRKFDIYRWNPDDGAKPRTQTYEIDLDEWVNLNDLVLVSIWIYQINLSFSFVTQLWPHGSWCPDQDQGQGPNFNFSQIMPRGNLWILCHEHQWQ